MNQGYPGEVGSRDPPNAATFMGFHINTICDVNEGVYFMARWDFYDLWVNNWCKKHIF